MTGATLLDADIHRMTIESSLLSPFSSDVLKEASYDIRVGQTAIVVLPAQQQGYVRIDVEHDGGLEIPDSGGIIDPGYCGHLSFTVVNVGPSPVHLAYGEPFVTTEFVHIGRPASVSSYSDGILEERLLPWPE